LLIEKLRSQRRLKVMNLVGAWVPVFHFLTKGTEAGNAESRKRHKRKRYLEFHFYFVICTIVFFSATCFFLLSYFISFFLFFLVQYAKDKWSGNFVWLDTEAYGPSGC